MGALTGLMLDVIVLWAIGSILARHNLAEDLFRFLIAAVLIAGAGVCLALAAPAPPINLAVYLGTVLIVMHNVIGATWLGGALGSLAFVGYKMALAAIL